MKISYNWLKEFVDFSFTPEELSEILTNTGLEVEGVEKIEAVKGGLIGVIVGEVMSCTQHPDADKLNVTEVFTGSESLQIVCGAPNVAKGQKVLVATVGCTLYPTPEEPFTIKKAKIRGVESCGMICAEDELGIGKDHNGIMVLPIETQPGTLA
ncbi:MAG: YtpR family tRNA-binding protein, partial [Crocinitomicaceae bacterium]